MLDQKIFPGMFFLSLILSFLNLDKLSRCFGFGSQNRSYFIFGKRLGQKKCNKKLSWWCFPVIYLSEPWFIDLLILNTDHHILSNENRKTTKIFYSLNELDTIIKFLGFIKIEWKRQKLNFYYFNISWLSKKIVKSKLKTKQ